MEKKPILNALPENQEDNVRSPPWFVKWIIAVNFHHGRDHADLISHSHVGRIPLTVGIYPIILLGMEHLSALVLAEIDAFLERHDMAPTTLGKLSVNDGHVVHDLRRGVDCTVGKIERIRNFMRTYRPPRQKKAPAETASA